MKIGIFCNKKRDPKTLTVKKLAKKIETWLRAGRHEVYQELGGRILKNLDIALVMGGDGLVLYAANILAPFKVPIFRVNFGLRGFLTNIEPEEIFASLKKILRGDFYVEEKNRILAEIFHGNKSAEKIDALNEIAVGGINRTVAIRLCAEYEGESFTAETIGDGIIISTKTGSTAYNLNAGGPMLLIENTFSVTANNAFFSSEFLRPNLKSFVVPVDAVFKIEIINQNKANLPYVVADGQRSYKLKKGDCIIIKKSPAKTLFAEIGK